MKLSWQDFKQLVDDNNLNIQYTETEYSYLLKAYNQTILIAECELPKIHEDISQFETVYKTSANSPLDFQVESVLGPFAKKTLTSGHRIFKRLHGISAVVSGAPDNIDFVIPYNNCKITGVEIINGDLGDTVNLKVFDTPTGTISGTANQLLNQFGYNVNVSPDFYKHESNYDADLIKDMKIRLEYDSVATDLLPKTVYINIILHEVIV